MHAATTLSINMDAFAGLGSPHSLMNCFGTHLIQFWSVLVQSD